MTKREISLNALLRKVAKQDKLTVELLRLHCREDRLVIPRHRFMAAARRMGYHDKEIGLTVNRKASTVNNGAYQGARRLRNPDEWEKYAELVFNNSTPVVPAHLKKYPVTHKQSFKKP